MNSFKKISLVIAAALTGTMLAIVPAQAVPTIAVTVNTTADTDANTVLGAAVVTVPSDNKVDAADAVSFALTGIDTGTVVTVTTAGGALIVPSLHLDATPVTSTSGVTSYSVNTGTGSTAAFHVYTKTTATGTITITNAGNTYVYYVKGTAGPAYNLSTTVADTASTNSVVEYSTKVTDVFGNVASATPTVTVIGAVISTASSASDATTGISKVSITYPATAGQAAINFAITATDVPGLPVAVKSVTKFVNVSDLATVNASLVAALAAEKAARAADAVTAAALLANAKADAALAKVAADKALADAQTAAAVTLAQALATKDAEAATAKAAYKAQYNALATKWNKKNPKSKVALLK